MILFDLRLEISIIIIYDSINREAILIRTIRYILRKSKVLIALIIRSILIIRYLLAY